MKNQVQLITYADRLTANGLDSLKKLLRGPLNGLFSGVHILPFFIQSMEVMPGLIRSTTLKLIQDLEVGKI